LTAALSGCLVAGHLDTTTEPDGWPQLTMASRIAGYAADNRTHAMAMLWLFAGLLLFPVSAAGVV
jgi:hypothetical protein